MGHIRTRLLTIPAALVLALSVCGIASAHAKVDHSSPKKAEVVTQSPQQVSIWATEELDVKASTAKVTNEKGERVDIGASVSLGEVSHKLMVVLLKPNLPAGTYTVSMHTVSAADANVDEENFTFTIAAQSGAGGNASGGASGGNSGGAAGGVSGGASGGAASGGAASGGGAAGGGTTTGGAPAGGTAGGGTTAGGTSGGASLTAGAAAGGGGKVLPNTGAGIPWLLVGGASLLLTGVALRKRT